MSELENGPDPNEEETEYSDARVPERPLHVRVAEALGNEVHEIGGVWYTEAEMAAAEARHDDFSARPIPHYDTDWSATGPLIEKYHVRLMHDADYQNDDGTMGLWAAAYIGTARCYEGLGLTPLIACCNLILALKAAGKLD